VTRETTTFDAEIFSISPVISPDEASELIARGEAMGFEAATVRTSGGPQMMTNVRNNDRVVFDDPALAESLWERVRPFVPAEIDGCRATGLFPQFRYYRYDPGQRFKRHKDGAVETPGGERSRLTFLIYLNTDYVGGETVFSEYEFIDGQTIVHEIRVRPEVGLGLFFVHERKHEGSAVESGRKYVLRTDVLYEAGPTH
jgi:predicted 2-oxoglutarate/Fe(II)-dependent dioxygenase YbiX